MSLWKRFRIGIHYHIPMEFGEEKKTSTSRRSHESSYIFFRIFFDYENYTNSYIFSVRDTECMQIYANAAISHSRFLAENRSFSGQH